jgi:ACS family hexuronate transporter-like MFS transporter
MTENSRGWHRWIVCALLFFATTINYIDRQVIGILKPTLETELGWNEIDYGNIVFAFQLAYAVGFLFSGRLVDRLGVRLGMSLAVVFWSLAAMGHGAVRTLAGFRLARFGLGLAEAGCIPAAIKAISEWFPKKERALATGFLNAGSNMGALLTPMLVPWITIRYGWPAAFYFTGALGFLWIIFWLAYYHSPDRHPRLSAQELAYIRRDPPDPPVEVSWLQLLRYRPTWAFTAGFFVTAPIWWFYLYWTPDFFHKKHGLDLLGLGPPLVVNYLMTDVGSIGGGWLSSFLIHRGWSVNAGRKVAMLVCALCVVPIFAAPHVSGVWSAVLLIGLAASAHQGFAANMFTLVSDTMPRQAVGSVVGIGGMAGSLGGLFVAKVVSYVLEWTGSYVPLFAAASSAYLIVLLIIHLLVPRLTPVSFERDGGPATGR